MSERRLIWYPTCDRKAWEWLLSRLLDMERDGKITIWMDHDEDGQRFYDVREIEGSTRDDGRPAQPPIVRG